MATAKMNIKKQGLNFTIKSDEVQNIINSDGNQIVDIPNEQIVENNKQHFRIHDETVEQLAERISKDGQLSPCIVCPLSDGKYELIDGRHRRRAVIKAGLPTTKCIIKTNLTDNQKTTIRITSNIFRNNDYLPSEVAFSLKELVEMEGTHDAVKKISQETNTGRKKIYRYLRLTYLIKPLIDRVDSGCIPLIAAVELSYLKTEEQQKLFEFLLNHSDCRITTEIAREIKEEPDNLSEIFYTANVQEPEPFEIEDNSDNLSTLSNPEISIKKEKGNISKAPDIPIKPEHIDLAARAVIDITDIDYLIVKKAYNTKDTQRFIKERHAKVHHGGNNPKLKLRFNFDKKLELNFYDGGKYSLTYTQVDELVRQYIRKNYTANDLISLIKKDIDI